MVSFSLKQERAPKLRTPAVLAFPSIVCIVILLCRVELEQIRPSSIAQWTHVSSSDGFLSFNPLKKCDLVVMIITSEADHQNGTMNAWFSTLPKHQTDRVCCVSVRRSTTTFFDFEESSTSCDTLFVPMIREDKYLTISEKVHLGFYQIAQRYDFKWLLKTDADSFVCFSRILSLLENYDPEGLTYLGYAESRNILLEDPAHKWYDPSMTDIVHNSRQPVVSGTGMYHPYMQGAGYVLSRGALNLIRSVLPSLRYSPMEDAMVGSWLLAFNTHWGVLNLDLRGKIWKCIVPDYLYISHYRKGPKALARCLDTNPTCGDLAEVQEASVREISFLITSDMEARGDQALELYDSIRAIFPTNEILLGDVSRSNTFLTRLLERKGDRNLRGHSFPGKSDAGVKNVLVDLAIGNYVCILKDVQRLSWETMMGKMLHPVQADEVDIAVGYLVFNPNMMNSSHGLVQYGYTFEEKGDWLVKHVIEAEMRSPQKTYDVHGTTGFMLAKKTFLLQNSWRDFGPFSDDDFHLRLFRKKSRIRLVNSGIRHGYHHPLSNSTETLKEIEAFAPKMCGAIKAGPGTALLMQGCNVTLDCTRKFFKREYENANMTSLNAFYRWS